MNKTLRVSKHEFARMVKSKGFIIVTLLFPILAFLILGGYQLIRRIGAEDTTPKVVSIGYVDEAGGFDSTDEAGEINLVRYESSEQATEAMLAGDIDEYFIIPPDYVSSGVVKRFTLNRELEIPGVTIRAVRNFLLDNMFEGQVSNELLERAKSPVGFNSTRLDRSGQVSTEQGGLLGVFLIPYLFGLLFWVAVLMGSSTLLEGLSEEKENRVMEILISSVSAKQLFIGKIVGLGAAGLLQIVFWFVSARFIAGIASASIGGMFTDLEIPTRLIAFGIVYFVLGYLLFAILFSIIGAVVPTYREGQQLTFLLMPLGIIPLALTPFFAEHPGHPLTYVLTFFPISAPVTSMIRIGGGSISSWELALAIVILVMSTTALLFVGARIFRTFLLMYGKRPTIKEIFRSLRQS